MQARILPEDQLFTIWQNQGMQIDALSAKKILHNAKNVVVFGMSSCAYRYVSEALQSMEIDSFVMGSSTPPFELIKSDKVSPENGRKWLDRECKSLLSGMIFYNYTRSKQTEVIIPLLFVISISSKVFSTDLVISRVFQQGTSPVNAELRRLYKLYSEFGDEFKKIVDETVKFVSVRQTQDDDHLYTLVELPSIWLNPIWNKHAELHKLRNKKPKTDAAFKSWRVKLLDRVGVFNLNLNPSNEVQAENKQGCLK